MFFKKKVKRDLNIDKSSIPKHIAVIMDGNGRWAKKRGLPRNFGHREGSNVLKRIADYCDDLGVKHLTAYTFSTENWKRPKKEIDFVMDLLLKYLNDSEKHLKGKNIRFNVIGDLSKLSDKLISEIRRVEDETSHNSGLNLVLAINYGSRDELTYACKNIAREVKEGKLDVEAIDEDLISKNLYTYKLPDPDLLIRTSGEYRISNYLLWQLAYAEFYFTDVLWPDFSIKHLEDSIIEYQNRNRRYGGI